MGHLLWFAGFLYFKNVKHEIKFLWPMASVSVDLLTSERERQPVSLLMLCRSGLKAHLRECFSCSNFSNLISISSLLFCTNHISMECEARSSTLLYYISRSSGYRYQRDHLVGQSTTYCLNRKEYSLQLSEMISSKLGRRRCRTEEKELRILV